MLRFSRVSSFCTPNQSGDGVTRTASAPPSLQPQSIHQVMGPAGTPSSLLAPHQVMGSQDLQDQFQLLPYAAVMALMENRLSYLRAQTRERAHMRGVLRPSGYLESDEDGLRMDYLISQWCSNSMQPKCTLDQMNHLDIKRGELHAALIECRPDRTRWYLDPQCFHLPLPGI